MRGSLGDLDQFLLLIPNEEAAVAYFTAKRWRNGAYCPYCSHDKIYHRAQLGRYSCRGCGYSFSIRTGTIFHNSRRPMREWLALIWLATETRKPGLTSRYVADEVGIRQSSAWSMLARLRWATSAAIFRRSNGAPSGGEGHSKSSDAGRRYQKKLAIKMSFDEVNERLADVAYCEIQEAKARTALPRRVQRQGWRGRRPPIPILEVDPDEGATLPPEDLVGAR